MLEQLVCCLRKLKRGITVGTDGGVVGLGIAFDHENGEISLLLGFLVIEIDFD